MDNELDETRAEKTLRLIEAFDHLLQTCDEEGTERSAALREAEAEVLRSRDAYLRWLQDELLHAAEELPPALCWRRGQETGTPPARKNRRRHQAPAPEAPTPLPDSEPSPPRSRPGTCERPMETMWRSRGGPARLVSPAAVPRDPPPLTRRPAHASIRA